MSLCKTPIFFHCIWFKFLNFYLPEIPRFSLRGVHNFTAILCSDYHHWDGLYHLSTLILISAFDIRVKNFWKQGSEIHYWHQHRNTLLASAPKYTIGISTEIHYWYQHQNTSLASAPKYIIGTSTEIHYWHQHRNILLASAPKYIIGISSEKRCGTTDQCINVYWNFAI
jgi:hypothetical protein